MGSTSTSHEQQSSFLQSTYPVFFPEHAAFTLPDEQFQDFVRCELGSRAYVEGNIAEPPACASDDSITLVSAPSTTDDIQQYLEDLVVEDKNGGNGASDEISKTDKQSNADREKDEENAKLVKAENRMLTENRDVAYRSTTNPLVDLFSELEEVLSGPRLRELLAAAWKEDSLAALKIIFNARSIHLGKSSRSTFYRCAGWLAQEHPETLLVNLQWLSRPLIEKKVVQEDDNAPVLVEAEKDKMDQSRFDVKDGVAHGYYKDLLNILVLAVNSQLNVLTDPRDILNVAEDTKKSKKEWNMKRAKEKRHGKRDSRHDAAVTAFKEDTFYRALYITVTRLFASQLTTDLGLLHSGDSRALRQISLCAKWAPSHKLFHDKHTFIVSSIAEILHSHTEHKHITDRQTYLRYAREAYRKDVSALRKALGVVERDISANTISNIEYDKVPSLAMTRHVGLFARKDTERFEKYVENVALGKRKISGAVLLPSKIIHVVRTKNLGYHAGVARSRGRRGGSVTIGNNMEKLDAKVVDAQWNALVQRIRDSGKLSSSIAVCDVSASMNHPSFPDGTVPMDSAIGLSLLVAEVTAPPFGGHFITFSSEPRLHKIDLTASLQNKVRNLESSQWNMSTDFVAVFEKLVLPEARRHDVRPEDMVKQILVFSDMQFNQADNGSSGSWNHTSSSSTGQETCRSWSSSYERVNKEFENYGYEMPRLIFWNLAGGRAGFPGSRGGAPIAPKPVTSNQEGTSLVSGYSQGMLKIFLEGSAFEDLDDIVKEEIVGTEGSGEESSDEVVVVQKHKKIKMTPLIIVKKAISHKAYSMLTVVD